MDKKEEEIAMLVKTEQELTLTSVYAHLQLRDHSTPLMPFRPLGGTVYLYYNPGKEDDWRADGYRWNSNGRRLMPPSSPIIIKKYFQLLVQGENTPVSNKEFRKTVFHMAGDPKGSQGTLIQYLGTVPKEGVSYPHGNNKQNKPYIRTAPSVLQEAKNVHKNPSLHYNEKHINSSIPSTHVELLKPRNIRQIKNAQAHERRRKGKDDNLFNLAKLTYILEDFIHRFVLVPEVGVVLAHRAMLQEFRAVLSTTTHQAQLLSYQTTDKVGDFYISSLLFRHTLFNEAPVMPVAFLIHENKTQFAHEVLMEFISTEVSEIAGAYIVTAAEESIKAIKKELPQVKRLCCWNNLQVEVRNWLLEHAVSENECRIYSQDLNQLLMSPSENDYKIMYEIHSLKWSDAFVEYYNQKVHPEVTSCAGRWILEPLGVYNGYNGFTVDQCGGFNILLGAFVDRKEHAIESFSHALYYLQCYFNNEIQLGRAGQGKYTLSDNYKYLRLTVEEIELEHSYTPEEIFDKIPI